MGRRPKLLGSSTSNQKIGPANTEMQPLLPPGGNSAAVVGGKGKKKNGARLWMRFDRTGQSELIEWDKSAIMKRVAIPARDLRILGPVFSHSSNILAREKAMVVNLEFIKAIVTAEEILLLDPLRQEVLPFVDQLRQQFPRQRINEAPLVVQEEDTAFFGSNHWFHNPEAAEVLQSELPFEFQVLEIALEVVCTFLDSKVADLEREAYPVLDELAKNVSTKRLERVRSLKSTLTRLLARVQKVRDELEHLLDDNEDMAYLYLTRRHVQNQQLEASMLANRSNSLSIVSNLPHAVSNSQYNGSSITSPHSDDDNVEDLEMLLEAYFMQLDGTRNKILSVREYIDDTEDYVNIQLDNQRNELIQLQLILTIASFAIAIETLIAAVFGMNIPYTWNDTNGVFGPFVISISAACLLLFLLILGYGRWKRLIGV
ncbi:magnesium transporter MRS2-4-like [Nymphaea colorata]|nr:magnesium transporter MRS2-4-like [Nymphaea colorata]